MSRRSSIRRSSLVALALTSTCIQLAEALPAPIQDAGRLQHRASICSAKGYSGDTDSYRDTDDGSYSACAAACAQQTKCKSFAYGNDECHLFDVPVDGNLQADSKSAYTFFDSSCPKPSTTSSQTGKTTTKVAAPTTTTTSSTKKTTTTTTTKTTTTTTSKATTTTTPKVTTTTTTKATKPKTTATTTSSKKTTTTAASTTSSTSKSTPAPQSAPKSGGFSKDTCTGKTIQDPTNKGCGCTYTESCGGGLGSGEIIEASLPTLTYNECIAACDVRKDECIGVVYQPFYGECWLYKSAGKAYKDSNAWFVKKTSCDKPCAAP